MQEKGKRKKRKKKRKEGGKAGKKEKEKDKLPKCMHLSRDLNPRQSDYKVHALNHPIKPQNSSTS